MPFMSSIPCSVFAWMIFPLMRMSSVNPLLLVCEGHYVISAVVVLLLQK